MEVEFKERPDTVSFETIEVGDLFYNNDIYMKLDTVTITTDDDRTYNNAIRLSDGKFDFFLLKEKVNRVEGKLVAEVA